MNNTNSAAEKKKKNIILAAVGGLVLLVILIIGGAIFGGSDDTEVTVDDTNGEQQTEETTTETDGDESDTSGTSDSETDDGSTTTIEDDQTLGSLQDIDPKALFYGIASSVSLDTLNTDGTQPEEVDLPEDPAAVRQLMVEQLESQGMSEDVLADFFAAYDATTSDALAEKIATWTEDEGLAFTSAIETATAPALEGIAGCLLELLPAALAAGTDPELAENPELLEEALAEDIQKATDCFIESMNELGRQILAVLEEYDLT